MSSEHRASSRRWPLVIIPMACALSAACASALEHTTIGEGPRGAVYLERLPSRGATAKFSGPIGAFQAAHPIALPPELLARALTGLRVGPDPSAAHEGRPLLIPLFTDEDVTFLAPLIGAALSRAAPDQRIGFLVLSDHGGRVEGTMFADRAFLHVTLARYELRNAKPPVPLDSVELSFLHPSAQHRNSVPQSWMLQEARLPSISLDYRALKNQPDPPSGTQAAPASLPAVMPPATHGSVAPGQSEIESLKELLTQQADEIRKLWEEVETLRHQSPAGPVGTPPPAGKKRPAPSDRQP